MQYLVYCIIMTVSSRGVMRYAGNLKIISYKAQMMRYGPSDIIVSIISMPLGMDRCSFLTSMKQREVDIGNYSIKKGCEDPRRLHTCFTSLAPILAL